MLVFRNNKARGNRARRNPDDFQSSAKSLLSGREQSVLQAGARAEAEAKKALADQPKRRGRPSKAQMEADAQRLEQARTEAMEQARTSFLAPPDLKSVPRTQKSESIARDATRAQRRKVQSEARAAYADASVKELRDAAKEFGIEGYSRMTRPELLVAVVRAEVQRQAPMREKKKETKVRKPRTGVVPSTETRQKISQKHKAKEGRRAGVGIYRVAIFVNGTFDPARGADLGPYATARAAAIDAKTLLRTAARVEDHRISQTQAQAMIDAGADSLLEFESAGLGTVVDGFIVLGTVNGRSWEAWVYRVNKRAPATSRALLDNVLPAGDRVESMTLRANSRRNSRVSFRTRDGRKVSFRSRK